MARNVKIGTPGIKSVLRKLKFSQTNFCKSLVEYIWNGFDAKADTVELKMEFSKAGTLQKLSVKDNGTGIVQEELAHKFEPFFESDKVLLPKMEKHSSEFHGSIGIGRLTFFTFAYFAKWTTVYTKNNKNYKYDIGIEANSLKNYTGLEESPNSTKDPTGTLVTFSGFLKQMNDMKIMDEVLKYLKLEFGWYLELNKPFNKRLIINGIELDYSDIIGEDSEEFSIKCGSPEKSFDVKYIRWKEKLTEEYSKFYYLKSDKIEKYKENTTLNNQGDQFYHSLYISSKYFDDFNFASDIDSPQKAISGGVKSDEIFKLLLEELYVFLRRKRKPFLKEHSGAIIEDMKRENVIPSKTIDEIEQIQNQELETTIRGIYEIEPKIFSNLKIEQKKTLVGMLKILLTSEERGRILDIIEQVIKLDSKEREELDELLKVTKLSCIIKTMNLIKQRYEVLESLKKINFDKDFGANEVHHLQKIVENNTWIFGEQYHLIAAAEDDFEKALKKHRKEVYGETEVEPLDSPDKKKQVDIFLCKQYSNQNKVHNIIIELKHPQKNLGEKEVSQIKKYFRVILNESRFNANNYTWEYILIGARFDSTGFIESELKDSERYGEEGLIHKVDNQKIYVRKWSDVLLSCEQRHQFLNQHLEIEKSKIANTIKTPEDAVMKAQHTQ